MTFINAQLLITSGVSDKITEHYVDKVIMAFLNEVQTNKKSMEDAYLDCCKRFDESMRMG